MANVTNNLAPRAQLPQKTSFSAALTSESVQNMLKASLNDQRAITKFTTDIMAAVGANPKLKDCDPTSVIVAGLQCTALNLSTSSALGEAYIIPYGDQATFQVGKTGLVRLAVRSGMYADIDTIEVRQGEYKGKDKHTGKPVFEFIEDDEAREKLPVIGYLATFELKPEMGSFRKAIYFGKDKTLAWAKRYSKAFDIDLFRKYETYLATGEGMTQQELQKCSSPWYSSFDEMGQKTVLKQLLRKWGVLSVEMQEAFEKDDQTDSKPIDGVFTVSDGVTVETDSVITNSEPEVVTETVSSADGFFGK